MITSMTRSRPRNPLRLTASKRLIVRLSTTHALTTRNFQTDQKVAAASAAVANVPAGLKGVAPHLVAPAAADATKYGQEYADAVAAANDMKTFVDLAKGGNKIAYAYSPTEGVLTLNTA